MLNNSVRAANVIQQIRIKGALRAVLTLYLLQIVTVSSLFHLPLHGCRYPQVEG